MKKVLITGGSMGIGLAISKELVKKGFKVYNIDINNLEEQIDGITLIKEDLNNTKALLNKLKDINDFDLLINNAAIQIEKPFIDNTDEEIDKVMNTNIVSLIKLTKHVIKKMKSNSHIINISSVHGIKPRINKITYDISKAALEMFTKELALELAPNIRVNAISIGVTNTPMNDMFKDQNHKKLSKSRVPLNYILEPLDVAKIVINIISDDFKYLTGSIICYDGGRSLT